MAYGRIYLVTNKLNGKHYVGQTVTAHSRHGHGHAIKDAYKKYGFTMFDYQTLTEGDLTENQLDCFERFWVSVFDSVAPNGYNLEHGGKRGKYVHHSPNKGKKFSNEWRAKMSIAQKNRSSEIAELNKSRVVSEETKAKMRESRQKYLERKEMECLK